MTIAIFESRRMMAPISRNVVPDAREISASLSHRSMSLRKCASVSSALSSMVFGEKSNNANASCSDTVHTSASLEFQDSKDYHDTDYYETSDGLAELIRERRWSKFESLMKEEPSLASLRLGYETTDKNGDEVLLQSVSPLHVLCTLQGVPLLTIREALHANPSASQEVDTREGMLPIHLACQNPHIPVSVIELLVKVHPNGLKMKTKSGDLPLHLAAKNSSSSVVELLLSSYPQAARYENETGNLPLHNACSRSFVDSSMFRQVLKSYPEAAAKKNKENQLPLHVACSWRNPTYVVAALIHEYPRACQLKDANDNLPLELLTSSGSCNSCEYSLSSDPRFHLLKSAEARMSNRAIHDKDDEKNVPKALSNDEKPKTLKKNVLKRVQRILVPHVSSKSLKLTGAAPR